MSSASRLVHFLLEMCLCIPKAAFRRPFFVHMTWYKNKLLSLLNWHLTLLYFETTITKQQSREQ